MSTATMDRAGSNETEVTAGPTPALLHQVNGFSVSTNEYAGIRLISLDDVATLSARLRYLESVCRSYSGTVGDECASIREAMERLFA